MEPAALPRTLPLRLEPVAGESFTSFVDRLADAHKLPVLALLRVAGVLPEEDFRTLPRGYGITD